MGVPKKSIFINNFLNKNACLVTPIFFISLYIIINNKN